MTLMLSIFTPYSCKIKYKTFHIFIFYSCVQMIVLNFVFLFCLLIFSLVFLFSKLNYFVLLQSSKLCIDVFELQYRFSKYIHINPFCFSHVIKFWLYTRANRNMKFFSFLFSILCTGVVFLQNFYDLICRLLLLESIQTHTIVINTIIWSQNKSKQKELDKSEQVKEIHCL